MRKRFSHMSCEHCRELCVKYVIRTPDQLRKAIRIARNAINEGMLSEVLTKDDWYQYSFSECAEKMIWGDNRRLPLCMQLLRYPVRPGGRNVPWKWRVLVARV